MTTTYAEKVVRRRSWVEEKLFMGQTFSEYVRSLATPFNAVAGVIVLVGLAVAVERFTQGLAATTNLTDEYPWGLWIGFDVLCGVALAAGGYTLATTVYVFRLKEYKPIVRPAILTGFLGYFFVVVGLCFDLGRPWRLPFPMVVSMGVTSVMFLVAWHVALYLTCQFLEFSPAVFEWLGWKRLRAWAVRLALGATIFGVMLSTLHQSALGALFLLAPNKLHPLWYSPLIPLFFFVSSIFAGLSMVIVESMISHRVFSDQVGHDGHEKLERLTLGLGKAASVVMFTYFGIKLIGIMHADAWGYLGTPLGLWFLVELLGFVLIPCFLFARGAITGSVRLVRATAVITVLGIILNRINVSMVAFNWELPNRYFPRWSEFAITIAIVTVFILTFRWIVNRMPVLYEHPDFPSEL
ncbi:MAG: NrfD/PsrC family molybdoenzyme membrane anchor subunit [Sphingomonadaceae bacterium]